VSATIEIYDTTLRDGCQAEDIALTLEDKLRIAERLDDFGIPFIEGGWPGSNPRDEAFFVESRSLRLKHARIAAFGATHRAGTTPGSDHNMQMLVRAGTPVVTIFGKAWDLHVRDDLRISKQANLDIIEGSVRYLKGRVDHVIFDAEHFFDGFRVNRAYALQCVQAAADGGADLLCLCDTNGGRLPHEIREAVAAVREMVATPIGIHCHNDSELAVANSLTAVEQGAVQVQGTINGFGERCGNANLCSIIANLQLKMGYRVVPQAVLAKLQELSHFVCELANIEPNKRQAYVGQSAFAHKGGVHVAAVQRNPETYEHVDPAVVGNRQRVLVSDLSGRANIIYKAKEFGVDLEGQDPSVRELVRQIKELEHQGYQFEGAEASFELIMRRVLDGEEAPFQIRRYTLIDERRTGEAESVSEAVVEVAGPDGVSEFYAAVGNGPVHALDHALRKVLEKFFPNVKTVQLHDYKVRVLGGEAGTAAKVRVLIESGDGTDRWGTVGVSHNVIEASARALADSFAYKLYKDAKAQRARKPRRKPVAKSAAAGV
jgi:2-isopropylmalate synthase